MVQQLTSPSAPEQLLGEIIYPDSDGQPMADNTLQFEWIVTIKENLELLFVDHPEVFVAGDLLWYPVEGDNKTRRAPDAMVVFGRPKGYRGSYQQWKEDSIAPQVVFEVLSPGNTLSEMAKKLEFYQRFGVEEYYLYNPYVMDLGGWQRSGAILTPIAEPNGWVSPRLGIRFETILGQPLKLFTPQNQLFLTFVELGKLREAAEVERDRMAVERDQVTAERDQIAVERDQIAVERDQERQRADVLTAKLRELGIDPDTLA